MEQISAEEAKNWKIATPSEVKHVEVIIDGNDEIAIITPRIVKKFSDSNFVSASDSDSNSITKPKKGLDIQIVRNHIIKNNLPLNRGPASGKNGASSPQNIEVHVHSDKVEINDKNIEEPVSKSVTNKPTPKVIVDIRPLKKHIKNKTENKKIEKNSKSASKIVKHRRMVGGEVFREKKIEKIIHNVEKRETDKNVNNENYKVRKKYISDIVRNSRGMKNGK